MHGGQGRARVSTFAARDSRPNVECIFDVNPETTRDRQHRNGRVEVDIELRPTVRLESIDQCIDSGGDPALDPPLRLIGDEGGLDQVAVSPMSFAVHGQHARVHTDAFIGVDFRRGGGEESVVSKRLGARSVAEGGEMGTVRLGKALETPVHFEVQQFVNGTGMDRAGVPQAMEARIRVGLVEGSVPLPAPTQVEEVSNSRSVQLRNVRWHDPPSREAGNSRTSSRSRSLLSRHYLDRRPDVRCASHPVLAPLDRSPPHAGALLRRHRSPCHQGHLVEHRSIKTYQAIVVNGEIW